MPKLKFKCGECGDLHDDDDDALECCRPTISEVWICGTCNEHHDHESGAQVCCGDAAVRCPSCARGYGEASLDAVAICVADHCRTCNPMFDYDQQDAIESLHFQSTGEWENLLR